MPQIDTFLGCVYAYSSMKIAKYTKHLVVWNVHIKHHFDASVVLRPASVDVVGRPAGDGRPERVT